MKGRICTGGLTVIYIKHKWEPFFAMIPIQPDQLNFSGARLQLL